MTAYKKLYEQAVEENTELKRKIDELCNFDGMLADLKTDEAREVVSIFADRAKNRAELTLLIRALSKIKE